MPQFGERSRRSLETADPKLQRLFMEVIKHYDCTVLEGHRGQVAQEEAVQKGLSKTHWPDSKHNKFPSLAVDVAPYPINWKDTQRFYHFAGFVKGVAEMMGIPIRWGGDWDSDTDLHDSSFVDLPHYELRG